MLPSLGAFINSKLFKFFVLVVVPFLLGMALPHVQTVKNEHLGSPSLQSIDNDTLNSSAFEAEVNIPENVNSVFPIAKYFSVWPLVSFNDPQLCFADNGSYVAYTNGPSIQATISWTVEVNGKKVSVDDSTASCVPVQLNQKVAYRWEGQVFFLINRNESLGKVSVAPSTLTYHKFECDYGILQGIALIPAIYLFFWYPFFGIWKKIEKGWKEQ